MVKLLRKITKKSSELLKENLQKVFTLAIKSGMIMLRINNFPIKLLFLDFSQQFVFYEIILTCRKIWQIIKYLESGL